jgi:hypothetical protein
LLSRFSAAASGSTNAIGSLYRFTSPPPPVISTIAFARSPAVSMPVPASASLVRSIRASKNSEA